MSLKYIMLQKSLSMNRLRGGKVFLSMGFRAAQYGKKLYRPI